MTQRLRIFLRHFSLVLLVNIALSGQLAAGQTSPSAPTSLPQSVYGTLTAELQDDLKAYDFLAEMLIKANDPKLIKALKKQIQELLKDIKRLNKRIHDDCERINNPKTLEDQVERLAVLTDFRKKNIQRMVGEASKVLGTEPVSAGLNIPTGAAQDEALGKLAGFFDSMRNGVKVSSGLTAISGVMDVLNYWQTVSPFVKAADRASKFKAGLQHCPPVPDLPDGPGTPEVHPFGPTAPSK